MEYNGDEKETPRKNINNNSIISEDVEMTSCEYDPATSTIHVYMSDDEQKTSSVPVSSFQLTRKEEILFEVLLGAVSNVNDKDKNNITIRVAGGWVRDKVLIGATAVDVNHINIDSSKEEEKEFEDIDIALSGISGVEYAQVLRAYMEQLFKDDSPIFKDPCLISCASNNNNSKADEDNNNKKKKKKKKNNDSNNNNVNKLEGFMHKIGVISANPDQSKHLETATMNIFGYDIDFVHLRANEIYNDENRIPTFQIGTPLEDALRRDFTINTLFFNLNTRKVEEYVKHSLTHLLKDKIIQTPIDANITFQDDPLRILRGVRFAVRYNCVLSQNFIMAASDREHIHPALETKVSRERVGKEIEGMITGKNANFPKALHLLYDLGLAPIVFAIPPKELHYNPDNDETTLDILTTIKQKWTECEQCLVILEQMLPILRKHDEKIDYRMLYLASFLLPWFQSMYKPDRKKYPNKIHNYINWIFRKSLKFKNKDVTDILLFVQCVKDLQSIIFFSEEKEVQVDNEETITTELIRQNQYNVRIALVLKRLKDQWHTCFFLATLAEIFCTTPTTTLLLNQSLQKYQQILQSHDKCWSTIIPFYNGKELSKLMNLPRGPLIGFYLQEQYKYLVAVSIISKEEKEVLLDQKAAQQDKVMCLNYLIQLRNERNENGKDEEWIQKALEMQQGITSTNYNSSAHNIIKKQKKA